MSELSDQPYIIAEMACSHEGETSFARTIIDGAGDAEASAIQFQIWELAEMVVPDHPDWDVLERIELDRAEWRELADYARDRHPSLDIIACVYEEGSATFAHEELDVDAFKLHASDLSNPRLVRHVAHLGRRIDLSVGASTIGEITAALRWIREVDPSIDVWMMYGYQTFPTPTDAIRLRFMTQLQQLFRLPVGYQDHSDGDEPTAFWLPAAAFGMGVRVFEKHITHDRSYGGIDHEAALNPDEFADFVEMIRTLQAATGEPGPTDFSDEELRYRKYSKKSLVAARDLDGTHVLNDGDLKAMRTQELGLSPDRAASFLGRALRRDVAQYELIEREMVE